MQPRRNRSFDFLYAEICVAVGRRLSRYALWLALWDVGADPAELSRDQVHTFIEQTLDLFIANNKGRLSPRAKRRLHRRLLDFDPGYPTPEEWLAGLGRTAA